MNLFEEYVRGYDFNNDKIVLKYRHTLRVQTLCEMIAKGLNLSRKQIKLASLCGLFHDIGRFKQVTEYDSFDDLLTIDHGDLGYEIFLKEFANNLSVTDEEKQIIATSIKEHNKVSVNHLTDDELLFTKIVRDADKLDIMYIYSNIPGKFQDSDGEISDIVKTEFYNHKAIDRQHITNTREKNILTLAFIWDINFKETYQIIKDNGYYEKIEKILNNVIYNEFFEEVYKFLKEM